MLNLKRLFLISQDMEGDTDCRECQGNERDRLFLLREGHLYDQSRLNAGAQGLSTIAASWLL